MNFLTKNAVLVTAFLLFSGPAAAQLQKPYEPHIGQAGKDVIWVPTPDEVVDRMLRMAQVTKDDYVVDLGAGDGKIAIAAAKKFGARSMGIEYNPDMVELAKRNAAKEGVTARATFVKADLFETDFSKATVITLFLLPDINLRLRPKILDMKPGTRIVSNTFTMGDWQADQTGHADNGCESSWCTALLWIVPAKVAGSYKTTAGDVTLKQEFQMLSGTLRSEGKTFALEGKVIGEDISFAAGGKSYTGRLKGKTLELQPMSARGLRG
jgi:precorrin-6B methylase 2